MDISVICNTYNQVLYIEKAIRSLVTQKTNVAYEVIVHDDKSTDGTQDVIRRMAEVYPDLIVPFFEEENQYSKGKNITRDILLPNVRGKYIALCEGDDFWIDDTKLQKQWELMEIHPECDMCACRSIIVDEEGERIIGEVRPGHGNSILTPENVIGGGGRYIATPSLFYRKSLYDKKTRFESVISFDYTLQIKGALRGGICYIDKPMAAYRDMAKGSWSVNVAHNKQKIKEHNAREVRMLEVLDEETNRKYHSIITERIEHGYTPFLDQLMRYNDELSNMKGLFEGAYLWGLGMRGEAFEEYCNINGISLCGVCDKKNERVHEMSVYGNEIVDYEEVFCSDKIILASTTKIYDALKESLDDGRIVNLQKYMPWG